jgi:hypothetical protein
MNKSLTEAVDRLKASTADFEDGKIKPLEHSRQREAALVAGLGALAASHGVTLQTPLRIDSNGEFNLLAMPSNGADPLYGTGKFGEGFTAVVNMHSPRTGVTSGAILSPENGWCRMGHFAVESMLLKAAS